ncbi:MAG TPA: methyltransferase domain-containing protein [Burkholderiales bacterium]|nr:methyltransferase domain-containing protein [Burkholderiales bacterium]
MSIHGEAASLSEWFSTPLGVRLLETELRYFDQELADVFGFNAVQIGLPGHPYLRGNRIAFRCVTGNDGPVGLRSDPCALPLQTASVDLVVLPHVLEFSNNPHQVLREVSRILMPEGHVVLAGFNPWSLWGVRRLISRRANAFPWCGQFINLPRIKDWMALLGFDLAGGRMCSYAPPMSSEKWSRRWGFMESAGDRWWPFAGGVYYLHGIKRVPGMRLITPRWKAVPVKKKALAAVPHKTNGRDDAMAARSSHAGDSQ